LGDEDRNSIVSGHDWMGNSLEKKNRNFREKKIGISG
jgi:hypothetical protein